MKNVLIVDKDLRAIEMLENSLLKIGYNSNTCSPSNLALSLINLAPDIVLINFTLYVRNKQLFYHGKQRLSNACIIVTAQTIHDPIYIKEIGASSFILKPFDAEVLRVIFKQCLDDKI